MKIFLHKYRFELLLIALTMVLFNKIFVFDNLFFSKYIWPANMIFLGLVSLGVFHERKTWEKLLRDVMFSAILAIPIFPSFFFSSVVLVEFSFVVYILFYGFLFTTLMVQIVRKPEVNESVIMGSISGFLILIIVATFSFLLLAHIQPQSFEKISDFNIPAQYQQFSYFSLITLSTIGYGDITPISEQARLLAGFWGVVSQFYLIAIVGIIISKYTSKK